MKWLFLFLVMILAAFTVACVMQKPESAAGSSRLADMNDFDPALLSREIFNASNRARQRLGVRKLKTDASLDRAAEKQAMIMSWQLEVSHYSPLLNNENPYARVTNEGLKPAKVAENVASLPLLDEQTGRPRTYAELAGAFVQAWLDSPVHRVNLLRPDFQSLGCGTRAARVPRDLAVVFASQVFLTPQEAGGSSSNAAGALRK